MHFCEQCGSSSRDKDGFCGGCGAPWPLETPPVPAKQIGGIPVLPVANLPDYIGSDNALFDVRPKVVWVAVLLALFFGPFGLIYCTITGTIVMFVISIVLQFLLGSISLLITLPICAFWAWRASRESQSALD
jgi:hypothetical protein